MRRLLAFLTIPAAVAAATIVLAAPVSAQGPLPCEPTANGNGAAVCTVHFTSTPAFAVPFPCSSLAGWVQVDEDSGNGVFHFAGNANGFWVTGTYEGDIQIHPAKNVVVVNGQAVSWDLDTSGTRPSAQGHVADWFGESFNLKNVVLHDAVNAQVTTSDGQAVTFHMIDHIQATPPTPTSPPVITHQFVNVSCS